MQTTQSKKQTLNRIAAGGVGLLGFIGFQAINAFTYHNPWYLFMPLFFIAFAEFRHWNNHLKYLGALSIIGLILGPLAALGIIPV